MTDRLLELPMDLTNAIAGLQQAKTLGEVQISVAKKILDSQRQNGEAAIQMIEAATGGVAKAGDALTASAIGLGGQLDTSA